MYKVAVYKLLSGSITQKQQISEKQILRLCFNFQCTAEQYHPFSAIFYINICCFTSDFHSLVQTLPYTPKTTTQNFGSTLRVLSPFNTPGNHSSHL